LAHSRSSISMERPRHWIDLEDRKETAVGARAPSGEAPSRPRRNLHRRPDR
jgi:hypothetical protein